MQPFPLIVLAKAVKSRGKSVLIYTGYTLERLSEHKSAEVRELLSLADTLIDGPYVESLRDLDLTFRGSANQRVLDKEAILAALHIDA